jgi:hypothetical protein
LVADAELHGLVRLMGPVSALALLSA